MHDVRNRFKQVWYRIDNLFNQYAKKSGANLTTILVLDMLAEGNEPHTQKEICEQLMLPKQLVNIIIKTFWEQGYVELKEAKDRRNKKIHLTESGKVYAESILAPFQAAEERALGTFTDTELGIFAAALEKYEKAMEENLLDFPQAFT